MIIQPKNKYIDMISNFYVFIKNKNKKYIYIYIYIYICISQDGSLSCWLGQSIFFNEVICLISDCVFQLIKKLMVNIKKKKKSSNNLFLIIFNIIKSKSN